MKKTYEKPRVYMERFELSQHIAKCDWDFEGNTDANNCYAEANLDGATGALFMSSNIQCSILADELSAGEDYCVYASSTEWGVTYNS